jgi:hypothetical protein
MLVIGSQILQKYQSRIGKIHDSPHSDTPLRLFRLLSCRRSYPSDESGVGTFNESEIPEHLRGMLFRMALNRPIPRYGTGHSPQNSGDLMSMHGRFGG